MKQAKSKTEIEVHTKHWTMVSDLLPLTYWYYHRANSVRNLDH